MCELKLLNEGVTKVSLNRANLVHRDRPETEWSIHDQAEGGRISFWRAEPV